MASVHRIYPPFLQEALDHAARLVDVLVSLESDTARFARKRWLVGRAAEAECVVEAVTQDWGRGAISDANAVRSILAYVQALHRGLAVQLGELAPACCVSALVVTATPVSLPAVTPQRPSSRMPPSDVGSTWEVSERELLDETYVPERSEAALLCATYVPGAD
jgi:hypothetical protein